MSPLTIGLIGLAAGVIGTGLGGVITAVIGKPSQSVLGFYMGFAGGIMLSLVFAEMIPEAMEEAGIAVAIVGMLIGVGVLILADSKFPHMHHGGGTEGNTKYVRMGYLLGFGIAIHNLPEGMAIGAGYAAASGLGLTLAIVLALHNIPEGIAMAAPLAAGGAGAKQIISATVLAGIPVGVGAFLGMLVGDVSPAFLSLALGFAGGAMLYISFEELLPEAHTQSDGGHQGIYGGIVGVIVGYILIALF